MWYTNENKRKFDILVDKAHGTYYSLFNCINHWYVDDPVALQSNDMYMTQPVEDPKKDAPADQKPTTPPPATDEKK